MRDKIKVLVIDDSITYRHILVSALERIAGAECVGTAASGAFALAKIPSLKPDLLLLDVVMPDLDGVETLRRARELAPDLEAIMISGFDTQAAEHTLRSLRIGALDFIAKPSGGDPEGNLAALVAQLQPLIAALRRRDPAKTSRPPAHPPPGPVPARGRVDLIVIGVSTGGPKALGIMLPRLPAALPCPVLIVQHLPPMFTEEMAAKLNGECPLRVSEAKGGETPGAGEAYIAPGGKHLLLERDAGGGYRLLVNEAAPVNNCRPSVDVLFGSVAEVFRGNVLAVVMTGMGRDGTEGVRRLRANGRACRCLVQDEASSVVWGMPGSVFEAGLADEVLPLDGLAARIAQLAQ